MSPTEVILTIVWALALGFTVVWGAQCAFALLILNVFGESPVSLYVMLVLAILLLILLVGYPPWVLHDYR